MLFFNCFPKDFIHVAARFFRNSAQFPCDIYNIKGQFPLTDWTNALASSGVQWKGLSHTCTFVLQMNRQCYYYTE